MRSTGKRWSARWCSRLNISNAEEESERQEAVALGHEQGDTHENRHSSARIECAGIDQRPH